MTDFDPTPPAEAVDGVRHRWHDGIDTFGRVYDVILGITDPIPYFDVAEIADCSPNEAKKHLERLTERASCVPIETAVPLDTNAMMATLSGRRQVDSQKN